MSLATLRAAAFGAAFLLIALPATAPDARGGGAEGTPAGSWAGGVRFGGHFVSVVLRIVEQDGDLVATIDFPDQGRKGIPAEITNESGRLRLRTPEPDGSADRILELELRGELATGHYRQPGHAEPGQAAFVRVVDVDPAALRLLQGEYRTASGAGFRVEGLSRATDTVLAVTFRSTPGSRTMFPVSPMEFVVGAEFEAPVPIEARLTFRIGDAGRVTEVEWREPGSDRRTARPVALAVDGQRIATFVESVRAEMEVPSFSLGVVSGEDLVYARSFGVLDRETGAPATPETLYQIASVTKTFTATLLAILRDEGVLGLDDPVAHHLPEGVTLPGVDGAPEITLRQLVTHSSGLPLQPVNYVFEGRYNNDYTAEMLHAGLAGAGLLFPPDSSWSYSNLGYILLADVMARATGSSFEELLENRLLGPLEMDDTTIELDDDELRRLATHYWSDAPYEPSPHWRPGPIAGQGGLTSSVRDMARYLSFQFRENLVDAGPLSGATLRELHRPQRQRFDPRRWVGHAWFVLYSPDEGEVLSHSGFTGGHSSYVAFSPGLEVGVIVLANFGRKPTDRVGRWLLHHVVDAAHEQMTATPLAARRFFFKGDWANAAWAYSGVAARDPGNGEAAFRLGASLFQIRRFAEAANAWTRAAESGYDPARSLYNAGSALAVMGRRDEAVAALGLALDAGLQNIERIDSDADWRGLAGYPPFEALRSKSVTPR